MKSPKRGDVLLADLVEALAALRVEDAATRAEVAAMLGFELASVPEPERVVPVGVDLDVPYAIASPTPRAEADGEAPALPIRLRQTATRSLERDTQRLRISAPPLDPPPAADLPRPPDPEPLLRPRWVRGIVSAALAGADRGAVDIARAVEMLARNEPLDPVPWRTRATLRHGVQMLLDRSASMAPFYRDQATLVEQLRPLVGGHRLEVLRFAGSPGRGAGALGPRSWTRYVPPRPSTTVLLVTDLGAGHAPLAADAASADEWRDFAEGVDSAGCQLVAFTPYPRERLPRGLPPSLRVVRWDRGTTARDARHARGRLRRAP